MLEITSIKNGLVIDHIEAGMGVKIFNYLHLDKTDYRVALIINAESKNLGKKDIIKIEKDNCEDIDYTVLGLLSPSITINEVKDERIVRKVRPELPEKVENILTPIPASIWSITNPFLMLVISNIYATPKSLHISAILTYIPYSACLK